MSKDPRPIADVMPLAQALATELEKCCDRVMMAGSLRRKKPVIGDIELVVLPKFVDDLDPMFGQPTGQRTSQLDVHLAELGIVPEPNGPRYKHFSYEKFPVDLFVQLTMGCWGMNVALRTGSADFSHWLMTRLRMRGYRMAEARVFRNGDVMDTECEEDVFRLAELDWVAPELRTTEWVNTIGRRLR